MAAITPQEVAEAVVSMLKSEQPGCLLDPEEYAVLRIIIAERAERIAVRKKREEMITGSLILSFIIGMIGLIGMGALDWVRTALKAHW